MLFFIRLIIVVQLCSVCDASRRIFDTAINYKNSNTFDCLIKPIPSYLLIGPRFYIHVLQVFETYQYCRRSILPSTDKMLLIENSTNAKLSSFAFDQLRSMNVTYKQLLDWYAPTDLIEEYIAGEQTRPFVNCSDTLWFGSECEYTLDSDGDIEGIIMGIFHAKQYVSTDLSLYTNGTCYEMINTNCESVICLDWREICDGKIDCKNGYDERYCQQLEMNECDPITEYRCHDGQCVSTPASLKKLPEMCSEESDTCNLISGRFKIECENKKCPKLYFSCGDGHCYDGPSISGESCHTQRDQRYIKQMSSASSSFILFSHVIINYKNTQPESICYNQTLCPYLSVDNHITTTNNNGLKCRAFKTFTNRTYDQFAEMIKDVKRLVRSCSLLPLKYNEPSATCPMFRCHDDNQCLSFYRLSDGIEDCTNGEDEVQTDVCSHNLTDRFICDNRTKCISERLIHDEKVHCIDVSDENTLANVLISYSNPFSYKYSRKENNRNPVTPRFDHICNGLVEYRADSNNNTDESDCLPAEWPCYTFYTRCDGVWNCPDGSDELGCTMRIDVTFSHQFCNNSKHSCFQYNTGHPKCLSTSEINDGIIDCVGSLDEREFCRRKYPFELERRYRCQNSTLCISVTSICDCKQDCPENDDETFACHWLYNGQKCNRTKLHFGQCTRQNREDYQFQMEHFCDLKDSKNHGTWYLYREDSSPSKTTKHLIKRQLTQYMKYDVIWSCNHGLYVRSRKHPEGFVCFCPDHYYGDRCQYQRKRILINLQMRMLTAFNLQVSPYIFVVLLVHTNQSNITISSHVQFLIIPQYGCESTNSAAQLLYPINEPYRSYTNHSIHIHMIDRQTLRHKKFWNFSLSLEFLPVQKLFKTLDVSELDIDVESKQIPIFYSSCKSCSNNSLCIGHDFGLDRDICICPPNFDGRRCLIPFDPCTNTSCNSSGKCQPTGIYYEKDDQSICLCDSERTGIECSFPKTYIYVLLAQDLRFRSSNTMFLHFAKSVSNEWGSSHSIVRQRFQTKTFNLTFIIGHHVYDRTRLFIQFYEHQYKFDYYILYYDSLKSIRRMSVEVQSSNRCRSINELFDKNILVQPPIRRIKNYQRPCLQRQNKDEFSCFYDNELMCVCREDNYTDCFPFQTNLPTCDKKWCYNRGMCAQDNETCPTYSVCICEQCSHGDYCEFSSNGYSLSLDGIIGSHISLTVSKLYQQSQIVQTAVILISIVVILGIFLNILSIVTFIHRETHEVGCGFYLLTSSIIGLLTEIVLISKMVLLLNNNQNNGSCSAVEFLLKWCPISCEWLNACIAFERTITVKFPTRYSRSQSKYLSKWITAIVLILIGCICMPEAFFRRIIINDIDKRAWCVLTLNNEKPGLLALYSILNILSFLIPWIINLSSGIIIVISTVESKEKVDKNKKVNITWEIRSKLIRAQILKHKHILIGPVILGILSLPRVILTFIFVCTKLDKNSIPSLIAYLVAFLPSMAIIFAFVWPSKTYRSSLLKSIKVIIPKFLQNWWTHRCSQH